MKNSFYILSVLFLMAFMPLPKSDKVIVWSTNKLTWADFEGKMNKSNPYDALTSSGISNEFSGEGYTLKFKVTANFFPKLSKKKKNHQTNELLNHEQRHFDITEIFARELRKSIQQTKFKKLDNSIGTTVNKLYNKNNSKWQKMQSQYDKETNHSKNKAKQQAWDTKIDDLLYSLEDYTTNEFDVDVSYLK